MFTTWYSLFNSLVLIPRGLYEREKEKQLRRGKSEHEANANASIHLGRQYGLDLRNAERRAHDDAAGDQWRSWAEEVRRDSDRRREKELNDTAARRNTACGSPLGLSAASVKPEKVKVGRTWKQWLVLILLLGYGVPLFFTIFGGLFGKGGGALAVPALLAAVIWIWRRATEG